MKNLSNKLFSKTILVIGILGVLLKVAYEQYNRNPGSGSYSYQDWFNFFTNIVLFLIVMVVYKTINKDDVVDEDKLKIIDELAGDSDINKEETASDKILLKVYRPMRFVLIALGVFTIIYLLKIMIHPGNTEKEFGYLNKLVDVFFIAGGIAIGVPIFISIYFSYIKNKRSKIS